MGFPKRRRQRPVAPFPYQTALPRGAMLGGLGNSLIPFSRDKFTSWGSPYSSGNGNRRRNNARFTSPLAQTAYGHQFVRQSPFRGYGPPRTPFSRLPGLSSYPGGYAGAFPRRPMPSMHPGYRMGPSAYRNPYMGSGYGTRPRSNYGRPAWSTPFRRPPLMRRGYPPSPRRHETYPTQWYNDTTFSDEEDDDYNDWYDDSDCEDTHYGSAHGRQRSYATDFDESEEDEEEFDEEYGEEDDYDYDQYDRYGSGSYSSHQYRGGGGGW